MTSVSPDHFEELAAEALDGLPQWVLDRMENVEVMIEAHPPPDEPNLLGRYEGIPLTRRGIGYAGVLPDRIVLFRSTIQRVSSNDTDLRSRVQHTVVHEIAHFFGISDERLREMDRY
jgi:predicted Zn-dependent protease with MMP-like domain